MMMTFLVLEEDLCASSVIEMMSKYGKKSQNVYVVLFKKEGYHLRFKSMSTLVLGVSPKGPMEKSFVSLDRELSMSS